MHNFHVKWQFESIKASRHHGGSGRALGGWIHDQPHIGINLDHLGVKLANTGYCEPVGSLKRSIHIQAIHDSDVSPMGLQDDCPQIGVHRTSDILAPDPTGPEFLFTATPS